MKWRRYLAVGLLALVLVLAARPAVTWAAEAGTGLTGTWYERMLQYCGRALGLPDPEQRAKVMLDIMRDGCPAFPDGDETGGQ